MKRHELKCIGIKDCGWNEIETYYKCPKCKEGVIIHWKDNTIGFKMSVWYKCSVCGFDTESEEWRRLL